MKNEIDWKQEAQKHAAEAGEMKITITQKLEEVRAGHREHPAHADYGGHSSGSGDPRMEERATGKVGNIS